jgi:hypothetical protein
MFALAIAMLAQATTATPVPWRFITSHQYGYSSCYPNVMKPIEADTGPDLTIVMAPNGDSIHFTSVRNTAKYSLQRQVVSERGDPNHDDERIVDAKFGSNWVIVTGTRFDTRIWRKTMQYGNRFLTVEISTASGSANHNALIRQVSACTKTS